jgi:DNA modification methylase
MIEINKNNNESNLETMARMPDNFIDIAVTSPPYAERRKSTYGGIFENEYIEWLCLMLRKPTAYQMTGKMIKFVN